MRSQVYLNGKVLDPKTGALETTNIVVSGGKVIGIGYVPDEKENEIEQIDISGKWVLPGITDVNTMVGEPGFSERETVLTLTQAAAQGGVSQVVASPELDPIIDNTEKLTGFQHKFEQEGSISMQPMVSVSVEGAGNQMTELARLKGLGAVAASDLGRTMSLGTLKNTMKYLEMIQMPLVTRPVSVHTVGKGVVHSGPWATMLGLPGISVSSEVTQLSIMGEVAAETGATVIVVGVSAARSVDLIARLKSQGVRMYAGVSIQHCWMDDAHVDGFDVTAKVLPPLRSSDDQEILKIGLREGLLDFVYSDHTPWTMDRKCADFCDSEFGVSTLGCFWPLVYTKLVQDWGFPLELAYRLVSTQVCAIFNLPSPVLSIGQYANFSVINPTEKKIVSRDNWYSLGKSSPYFGKHLSAWPEFSVLKGMRYF